MAARDEIEDEEALGGAGPDEEEELKRGKNGTFQLSESDYSVRQITVYGKLHTESDFPLKFCVFESSVFGFSDF